MPYSLMETLETANPVESSWLLPRGELLEQPTDMHWMIDWGVDIMITGIDDEVSNRNAQMNYPI